MEDLSVVFLDHAQGSKKNFVPPITTQENGQQDVQNYPGPSGNQHNAGFYGDVLPVGYFQQPPTVRDYKAHYGIQGTLNTNQNFANGFPIPSSTSQRGRVTTDQNNDHPEPLRRNPIRSVKKVSPSNLIGPNGTYISLPKISITKRSMPKPLIPKVSKIQKVDKVCPSKIPRTKKAMPKTQAPKECKIPKVIKVRPPKLLEIQQTARKQLIKKVNKIVPVALPPKPQAPKKAKIEEVKRRVPTAPPPKPRAPKKVQIQKVEKICPPKTLRIKQKNTEPQSARKTKIQKVEKTAAPPSVSLPQEDPSYQRLLALQESDLVPSTEGANCPVCNFWVSPGNGVVLKDCLHTFCRKCLESTIQKTQTALVKCPFACKEYECESHLQDREVKSLVSPEDYERHLARSVFQAQCQATNAFHCVMPGCSGWCLVDDIHSTWFACPMCMSKNCIPCRAIHNEMGCPNEDEVQFLEKRVNIPEKESSEKYSVPWELGLLTNSEDQPVDYRNLLEVTDRGLVTNTETFDCPICFSEIAIGEGVTLKDCLHNYCRDCLTGTIRHSDTVLVKCPFVNDDYSCESFLQEREIKSLLTPDEFERHLAMSLALVERQSANSFHCKTPDCASWCLVEDDANQFFCQVCQHFNCLSCAAIHEGKNCKQYQDMADLQKDVKTKEYLERQLKSNQAMACPTCQIIVMKREGCDWLLCSMCQTEICWATKGPRWGPGGKGDTSGGCKCDYKSGKLCHPKCYNCH